MFCDVICWQLRSWKIPHGFEASVDLTIEEVWYLEKGGNWGRNYLEHGSDGEMYQQ